MSDQFKTLETNETEKALFKENREYTAWFSKFSFLLQHNGFRPGGLHTFLGTTGGGKSTLMRSLLIDALKLNPGKTLGVYLSEESKDDLRASLSVLEGCDFSRAEVVSELDGGPEVFRDFVERIFAGQYDLVIIDNLTTMNSYNDQKPERQYQVVQFLKKLAVDAGVAIIIVCHTDGKTQDNGNRLLSEIDLRGSKSLVNLTQFLYVMQRFKINENFFPTITIRKYRGHVIEHSLFLLKFNKKTMLFDADVSLPFEEFKKIFKMRNTL